MPETYLELVEALKELEQGGVALPVAENEWGTRPDTVSYGLVSFDFERNQLTGDDRKTDESYEGSVDLYSMAKNGAGWVPLIRQVLTEYCGPCWELNTHKRESETGLHHWEWVFRIEG